LPESNSSSSLGQSFASRRTARPLSVANAVSVGQIANDPASPMLVQSLSTEQTLAAWIGDHRDRVETLLRDNGAVLFRGFGVRNAAEFRAAAQSISPHLIQYGERSSPRTQVGDDVYTATDHPADQPIVLHHEQSYTLNWPLKIMFFCEHPATYRGRTPTAANRRVLDRLPSEVVDRFADKGVMYLRNYLPGISLSWQEAFQTDSEQQIEAHCEKNRIEAEWTSGGVLRTRQVRPAFRNHPLTGETLFFNHALFFHVTSLPERVRSDLLATIPEQSLPYNTYYGDGLPLERETLEALRSAFDDETRAFDWQTGDVLVLDNMLVAHGREPFEGARRVLTVMADPVSKLFGAPSASPRFEGPFATRSRT